MEIIISCPGKFHIFNLAKELDKKRNLKKIFVGSPLFLVKNEGVSIDKIYSIPIQYIFYAKSKIKSLNCFISDHFEPLIFDYIVSKYIKNADIFHGFPGWMLRSSEVAKKRNIIVVGEGSSTHILQREKILKEEYKKMDIDIKPHNIWEIKTQLREYDLFDYLLVPSDFAGKSYIEYGFAKEKIIRIPYGVNEMFFEEYQRKKKDEIIIVGTIGIRKGTHYLLDAYRRLKEKDKKLRLHLIGFFREDMREIIKRNIDIIDFIGAIKKRDLPEYFSSVDILVHPSLEEGFGILPLEAMASGLPVILSENTGVSEIVNDGEDGIVIKAGDAMQIYDKLKFLVENEHVRINMGIRAKEKARLYTWERYSNEYIEIFTNIVKKRKG